MRTEWDVTNLAKEESAWRSAFVLDSIEKALNLFEKKLSLAIVLQVHIFTGVNGAKKPAIALYVLNNAFVFGSKCCRLLLCNILMVKIHELKAYVVLIFKIDK